MAKKERKHIVGGGLCISKNNMNLHVKQYPHSHTHTVQEVCHLTLFKYPLYFSLFKALVMCVIKFT